MIICTDGTSFPFGPVPGIGWSIIQIHLIALPTGFTLVAKPVLIAYDGAQITIFVLQICSPLYTAVTFPSVNKILSISVLSMNVPWFMAHILEKPSGIPLKP